MSGHDGTDDDVRLYYPSKGRVILHLDMNAFYCSVHEAEDPEQYKGQPTAVAGSIELRKGIIVTCSYAARKLGIRTGMHVRQALRLCPHLMLIRPDFHLYRRYSRAFIEIAKSYTPLVEVMSIDECYMDITGSKIFGTPLAIANELQQRIREELSLPCSIGVAPNKLLAKMASDMKKPNGITVLRIRDVPKLLWHKPCGEMFGIGQKTAMKLSRSGIRTIGELAQADEKRLVSMFGVHGHWMKRAANGQDEGRVNPEREQSKSIGHTTTLPKDVDTVEEVRRVLLNLADQVARRMRRQQLMTQTVQLTIRTPDMKTITRSNTLEGPTDDAAKLLEEAWRLYERHWPEHKPIRLLGITAQNLLAKQEAAVQLDLFDYEQQPKRDQLNETMDRIRDKYGENAIVTLGMLGDDPSTLLRNHRVRGTSLQTDFLRDQEE
ncbi:DNA polymerase IV [Paenibacillus apiarius]|uniref:DNA polymerase IV n=1 Tax=Paenibacillus apiarius TaxID=46240 RepID=A0ABT4E3L8_9BACL|nr:DNA polymerase IV [Paenibacillus apiarius]MBN3522790.1 DNA polymerase IV [Paenibacillus apiarius]MCY9515086.1 DNA polymerase IV [Paenibacillus apiarius]MCY9522928.1 DNA polymerase IV [Paenibacillus apiarius]MCY9553731.1 DNA polymerase IV [Paenibacillus apiarius]MCY9556436.1 DNA polymerase IV [Paenibacillus apiarius]